MPGINAKTKNTFIAEEERLQQIDFCTFQPCKKNVIYEVRETLPPLKVGL
jgi:hypothetical protein